MKLNLFILLGILCLIAIPFASAVDIIDQNNPNGSTLLDVSYGTEEFGNEFKTGAGVTNVSAITMRIDRTGDPAGNVYLHLWDAANTLLGTSNPVASATIPPTPAYTEIKFNFSPVIAVTELTTYHFTLYYPAGDATHSIRDYGETPSTYPDGVYRFVQSGVWGTLPAYDNYFITYYSSGGGGPPPANVTCSYSICSSSQIDILEIPCCVITPVVNCSTEVNITDILNATSHMVNMTANGDGTYTFTFNETVGQYNAKLCDNSTMSTVEVGYFDKSLSAWYWLYASLFAGSLVLFFLSKKMEDPVFSFMSGTIFLIIGISYLLFGFPMFASLFISEIVSIISIGLGLYILLTSYFEYMNVGGGE